MSATKIIAHRGGTALAPENSLSAFAKAKELGIEWIELDCHLSLDNELIVIHDDTVDRTSNGTGVVKDMTLEDLKKLDIGSHFSETCQQETIPTLLETLLFAKENQLKLYIEIKPDDAALIPRLLNDLKLTQMQSNVVIQSLNFQQLQRIYQQDPSYALEYIVNRIEKQHIQEALSINANAINPNYEFITPEQITTITNAGLQINPYTVNNPILIKQLLAQNISGIITDKPDLVLEILNA